MSEHGTRSRYVKGCRCEACCQANTAYKAAWRGRPRVDRPGVFESRPQVEEPEPVTDQLDAYADPDCPDCHGTGGTLADPCPPCIMAVWS